MKNIVCSDCKNFTHHHHVKNSQTLKSGCGTCKKQMKPAYFNADDSVCQLFEDVKIPNNADRVLQIINSIRDSLNEIENIFKV